MIDIKFLRENPEVVKENIKKKFQDSKLELVDEVIALDAESRKAKQEADDLRASRNKISKEIGALMAQGKKEEAEAKKAEVAAGAKRLLELEELEKELEEKAAEIMASIEKGDIAFEDAAKEYSSCPSNAQGGDLGEFGRGQMVPEFDQVAFEAEVGKVVGPVKTQFGYHLIKVEEV